MSKPTDFPEGQPPPEAPTAALATTTLAGEGERPAHSVAPVVLTRGASVGRYVVLDKLGAGGMGIVYTAFDPELDRRVALKLLHPRSFAKRPGTAKARLLREAQALAKLSHPSVVTVHDVGTFEEQVFVAMEFVDGVDLATWLLEDKRSWEQILAAYLDAGRGLAAAHEAGIVHRDFKPENVLVGRDGRVRVLDFGLARTEADDDSALDGGTLGLEAETTVRDPGVDEQRIDGDSDTALAPATQLKVVDMLPRSTQLSSKLTQVGAIMGTPAYMAPEQHQGQRTDARCDQFSFCVALYESLYGQRPYAGRTRAELLIRMLEGQIREPPRDAPPVPTWVRRVLIRGLATSPSERWPDMVQLLTALSPPPKSNRRGLFVGGTGLAVAAVAVVLAWPDKAPAEPPCQGAERKLSGIWDEDVRARVQAAFDATRRPYAANAFATSQRFLDEYTGRWVQMHTEACFATSVRKEQSQELLDKQMICLGRRLKEVRALTRLLAEADAEMVTEAVTATTALPQLEPCADAEHVMGEAAPLSGERRNQAAAVDDLIADARQLDAFGRYERAMETAREAHEAALLLDEPRRRAEATAVLGRVQLHQGSVNEAEQTLHEAVWLADESNDDVVRARAWIDLVWAVGFQQARSAEVEQLRRHAQSSLRRAGGNALLEADLHENLAGIARVRRADPETAMREHERALEIRRRELGQDAPQVATSLNGLAEARADLKQFEAAERDLEEAMTIFVAKLGRSHPRVASVLHTRGGVAYRRGATERAASLYREAIRLREESLPADHPDLAKTVHDLGEVLLVAEDHANALPQFLRAAKLKRTRFGKSHASIANSITGAGRCLAGLGRTDEAIKLLEESLAMHDELGTRGTWRAETEAALARALEPSDPARARTLALSARAQFSASGSPDLARALDDLLQPAEH